MEYLEKINGKLYRKYSNEAMRSIKKYIDRKHLKGEEEGYNSVIYRLYINVNDSKLRTAEERINDLRSAT